MRKWNKSVSVLLLALMMLASSCGGTGTPGDTPSGGDTSAEPEYQLPTANFGGQEFNIMLWEGTSLPVEEETGDVLNDAVFRRARTIEDMYNINLAYTVVPMGAGNPENFGTWLTTLNASILADDNSIHLAGGYTYQMASNTLNGGFANVLELPHLSLDKEWWPQNLQEAGNLGGAMYLLTGNIELDYYQKHFAILFNKTLAADYQIGDLYEIVRNGEWTLDKMMEICNPISADIDGNGTMDVLDRYGISFNYNQGIDAFVRSSDIPITQLNSAGEPELVGLSEKYVALYDKLKTFIYDSGGAFHGNSGDSSKIFKESRGLMSGYGIYAAVNFRDLDLDFGIIPYPKYDKSQENYITHLVLGDTTGFIVPVTTDPELAGCVLEAMAYLGYQDVLPQYYEKVLKGKGTRDTESEEMLDIIFNNVKLEFTQIYSSAFGDQQAPSMMLRMAFKDNKELSSMWASREEMYDAKMKELISMLK